MSLADARRGQALPVLERTLDLARLVAYAGATWDWYRPHYDERAAEGAGLPGIVVDGQLLGALLAEHAQDWAGAGARLRSLEFRFADMVVAGETVRVTGEVAEVLDDPQRRVVLAQRVWADGRPAIEDARAVLEAPERLGRHGPDETGSPRASTG